jgi:dGTPase
MSQPAFTQDSYNYCALPLAIYACRPDQSKGRIFDEPESKYRTCFQRDRDRLVHSQAFRRLKYKTQVFVYHQGDHYRTRLTHSLEVAQIARTMARALMVNEDLAETVALAHDLGHPPFAHSGEEALNECMKDVGGFDHNDQSLRVLTCVERKYPDFIGLNLSWETLEGVVKHNGPIEMTSKTVALRDMQTKTDLQLNSYATIEAQIAALADDIAYNNHDVEDGLYAGLFTLDDLREVPFVNDIYSQIEKDYPHISTEMKTHQMIRDMIGAMVEDVLEEAQRRLKELNPQSPDDIRAASHAMIAFSTPMLEKVNELRNFLWTRMYHHHSVCRTMGKVKRIVTDLYDAFMSDEKLLSAQKRERIREETDGSDEQRARIIADYIASMTDRYAIRMHDTLFDYTELR